MPINLSFDSASKILTLKVVGQLTFKDFEDALNKLLASSSYPSDVDTLWDLNEMEFSNFDHLFHEKIVAWVKERNNPRGHAKVALVSNYDLGQPILKLFIYISEEINQEFKSFYTIENGVSWLIQQRNIS